MKPRDWQLPAIKAIDKAFCKYGTAVNLSDTGTGKTFMTLYLCAKYGYRPLVVTVRSAFHSWKRDAERMGVELFDCVTYQSLHSKNSKYVRKTKDVKYFDCYAWNKLPDDVFIVWDEQHYCSGMKSQKSLLHFAHTRQEIASLNLTATLADSPVKMRAIAYCLGWILKPQGFLEWCKEHGCTTNHFSHSTPVWTEDLEEQKEIMTAINKRLIPEYGYRINKQEVPEIPPCEVLVKCLPPPSTVQVNKAHDKIAEIMADMKPKIAVLTSLLQMLEMLRVKAMFDNAVELLESGNSVVVFFNFDEPVTTMRKLLNDAKIKHSVVTGANVKDRQLQLDKFQSNEHRIIVVNIAAGGVSCDMHDEDGRFPRIALSCPTYRSSTIKQAMGRISRTNGKSKSVFYICYLSGTREEKVAEKMEQRVNSLDTLNDGEMIL